MGHGRAFEPQEWVQALETDAMFWGSEERKRGQHQMRRLAAACIGRQGGPAHMHMHSAKVSIEDASSGKRWKRETGGCCSTWLLVLAPAAEP